MRCTLHVGEQTLARHSRDPGFPASTSSLVISWILVLAVLYSLYSMLYIVGEQTLARHSRDPGFPEKHIQFGYLLDTCACSALYFILYTLYFILWESRLLLDTRGIPVICWMEVLAQSIHGKGQQGGTRKSVGQKDIFF